MIIYCFHALTTSSFYFHYIDVQGKYAPTGTVPDRWVLSGVHNATNNPENLVGFVVCMRKW